MPKVNFFDIYQSLYFFLPAMVANAVPPIVAKIPGIRNWNTPIDFGKNIFGAHKTIRGIVFGLLFSLLVGYLQWSLYKSGLFRELNIFDYSKIKESLFLGFLLGSGALGGDLVKSFLKRKRGIPPGGVWFLPDKIDYGVGAVVFSCWFFSPGIRATVIFIVLAPFLSVVSTFIGKIIGVRDVWI